jgi:hypothetical protein
MDLSKPPVDYLEQIDRQMKALEEETRMYQSKYGFVAKYSEPETKTLIRRQEEKIKAVRKYHEEGRLAITRELRFNYDKILPVIPDESEIKPIVLRPEISAEWVSANKVKPDLKAFYDKELYERVMFDPR